MRDSVCRNAFLESWNPQVGMAVDWSTCRWIGGGCDSWLDIVASTSLVKLIVSHILLGGGSFKECKWNIIRPIFKNYVTWNNSMIEQIHKKSSKNYVELTHQIKKVFSFVWKSTDWRWLMLADCVLKRLPYDIIESPRVPGSSHIPLIILRIHR